MTFLTLGQAAKETGKQKSTILGAIRGGRLSATRDEKKQWQIDPAELFRVYAAQPQPERDETQPNTTEQPLEISRILAKEQEERARERRQLENTIEDLRADRDHWRQQATALLTYRPEPPTAPAPEIEEPPAILPAVLPSQQEAPEAPAPVRSRWEAASLTFAAVFAALVVSLALAHWIGWI